MTSFNESFEEISESERQTKMSAQDLAAAPRREMPRATTACHSWKSEVMRRTKEVAEQSTGRTAWRNSVHHSFVPLPPPGMDCSQPFTSIERVYSPTKTSRTAVGNPCEHIPSTSTRDQSPMKVIQKAKKQRN